MEEKKKNFAVFLCLLIVLTVSIRFLFCNGLPFLVGYLLASGAEPMVSGLQKHLNLPRPFCAAVGVTAALAGLGIVAAALGCLALGQLPKLTSILPEMAAMTASGLDALKIKLLHFAAKLPAPYAQPLRERILSASLGSASYMEQGVKYILTLAGNALCHVPGSALGSFTAMISAYLFSVRRPVWAAYVQNTVPQNQRLWFTRLYGHLSSTVKGWLLCQLKLCGVTFCILAAGMFLLRLSHPLSWAALTALLDALPVLGVGTVLLPWCLFSLVQGQAAAALGLLGLYFTAVLVRSALEPKLMGQHLGLDPLVALASLYTGFRLWGFAGMILMPLAAVGASAAAAETIKATGAA